MNAAPVFATDPAMRRQRAPHAPAGSPRCSSAGWPPVADLRAAQRACLGRPVGLLTPARRFIGILALASVAAWLPAAAHELSMAEMQLRETAPGEFVWAWTASEKRAAADDLMPRWPEGCTAEPARLHCAAGGLRGTLEIEGVGRHYSAALVKIAWLDGNEHVYTLTAGQPRVQLHGAAADRRGWREIATAYFGLGVEHILTGTDHLLFVLGLLFLVGFGRRLVATITAFTLAHSLTLALSALGWLTLRSPPVEASIALSIVLVAREALGGRSGRAPGSAATAGTAGSAGTASARRSSGATSARGRWARTFSPHRGAAAVGADAPTLARRWPALIAFLFGLVHGLGFAGALKEIGLPADHLPVALLTFNLGVEFGQLLAVGVAWLVWRIAARWPRLATVRTAALYGVGTVAAFWSFGRIAAVFA